MPQSPEEMMASMTRNMKEKTGKELPEWIAIAQASGLTKHGEIVNYLKSEHGLTHGYANTIAIVAREAASGAQPPAGNELIDAQYVGKESLRPIYEAIISQVTAFGPDVEIAPKKAYVSLRRNKQFGLVNPVTKTRVDVGIILKGRGSEGRLEAITSANAMCTHNVRVTDVAGVDDELIGWLRQAYDMA